MKTIMDDSGFLLRQIARRPLLYVLIVLILALGIGANTAMFTLTDAVLFRDLPVHEPESLVRIFSAREQGGDPNNNSWPDYLALRESAESVSGVAAYVDWAGLNVAVDGGAPERINGGLASGNFFQVLGVRAVLGRVFTDDDDRSIGAHPVALLSHHYWRTRFDSSPGVIDAVITINRRPFTVIGVLPAGFSGIGVSEHSDIWLPLSMTPQADPWLTAERMQSPGMSWLDIVARLDEGATIEQLQAELDTRAHAEAAALAKQAETHGIGPWRRVLPARTAAVEPYGSQQLKRNALLLAGVVLLVLLLACANVAGLLGVRAEEREREFAVRASLGASRRRLTRMLLLETLLLAGAGATAGLAMAQLVLHWIVAQAPAGIVLPVDPSAAVGDRRVLFATLLFAVFVTVLVGIAPARRAARIDPAPVLKGGVTASAGRERIAWRGSLVVLQIGISTLILVGAGLLLRSLWNTARVDPGFEPRGAAMVMLDLSRHGLSPDEQQAFFLRVQERVAALPGVTAAGFSQTVPVQNGGSSTSVEVDNPAAPTNFDAHVDLFIVTPGFLDALGVPVIAGRGLNDADMAKDSTAVVLVNETMAKRFWPGENALDNRVLNMGEEGAQVIGVVADHKIYSVNESPRPAMYVPLSHMQRGSLYLLARSDRDAAALLPEIRRAIRGIDPELPVLRERTLEQQLANSYSDARLFAWLLGGFAVLALLLAAAGLYGMLAHVLRMRQREFGVRIALGADTMNIVMLVARQVVLLAVTGLLFGLAAAAFAGRALEKLLFGVSVFDAMTFTGVALLVLLIAAASSLLPVRRAALTPPTDVLREE